VQLLLEVVEVVEVHFVVLRVLEDLVEVELVAEDHQLMPFQEQLIQAVAVVVPKEVHQVQMVVMAVQV
jgi:hypothetical protein